MHKRGVYANKLFIFRHSWSLSIKASDLSEEERLSIKLYGKRELAFHFVTFLSISLINLLQKLEEKITHSRQTETNSFSHTNV